jgi:hypothetical protein
MMAINNARVKTEFDLIDEAIKKVESHTGDVEIASYLSSFLTVMICGVYEDCIEHLICQRAGKARDTEIYQYVRSTVAESFRNPKFARIVEILNKFSRVYAEALKNNIEEKSKVALDSIVDNKNAIAHGRPSNVTISDIKDYHNRCIPIFELLENILA